MASPPASAANSTSPPPPPPSTNATAASSSPSSQGGLQTGAVIGLIAGVGIGGLMVMIGLCLFVVCCRKMKKNLEEEYDGTVEGAPHSQGHKDNSYTGSSHPNAPPTDDKLSMLLKPPPPSTNTTSMNLDKSGPSPGVSLRFSQSTFTDEELEAATNGFSNSNLIGQGGFGYVYKGVLPNGQVVAIKKLKAGSGQGEREFQAEVEIISRVHHRHLVSLVGYCTAGIKRMLVYEFVPNNTMEYHLHGKGRPPMDWPTRMKIAVGAAKGLAYLHEDCHPKIIHRDIKATNILLDSNFEAMVADFGLAKLSLDTQTHISTRVMGTFGYLAPEYASSGKLTDKSDVYSFGVVLIELLTGRRPVDIARPFADDSIVDWARPIHSQAIETGNFDELVDPRLEKDYDPVEVTRMIASAAFCIRHSARHRPRMCEIVRALEGNLSLEHLNVGNVPGYSSVPSGNLDYDTCQYREDMKKFRKMALGSQELSNSQCSGPTIEFGQIPSGSSNEGS